MLPVQAEYFPCGLALDAPVVQGTLPRGPAYERRALTASALAELAAALRERCGAMRRIPTRELIRLLGRVHRDWARTGGERRREAVALLHAATAYPEEVLDRSIRGLFRALSARGMEQWLTAAGLLPEHLDRLAPPGMAVFGPELTLVVASGNIPGAAIPSIAQALLLKSPCLAKTSSEEPFLMSMYARSLAELAPELAPFICVTGWEGGRAELEEPVLAQAEALIAYGSDAAISSLRSRLPPAARFVGYGHRISFCAIGREMLGGTRQARDAARKTALDVGIFDQQGCLSPQAIYVERGGRLSAAAFAEALAGALEELEKRMPRRALDPAEAAAIHQFRSAMEMRALIEDGTRLWKSSEGTRWTVALDPRPALEPCPGNRTAIVRPLDDLGELPTAIRPLRAALMSAALGVGGARLPDLAAMLAAAGVTRICPLGEAQYPTSVLHHDGVNAIAALARYCVNP